MIIGAPRDGAYGAAYVTERSGGPSFGPLTMLLPVTPIENGRFGSSVGLSRDFAVVGTPFTANAAYLFERLGINDWGTDNNGDGAADQTGKFVPTALQPDARFGEAVSISGNNALIGASLQDAPGQDSGAAFTFGVFRPDVNSPPVASPGPDQTIECAGPNGATVTFDGLASEDPDGDALTFAWMEGATLLSELETFETDLPLGVHTITLTVEDTFGQTDTAEVVVSVVDTTAPVLSGIVPRIEVVLSDRARRAKRQSRPSHPRAAQSSPMEPGLLLV